MYIQDSLYEYFNVPNEIVVIIVLLGERYSAFAHSFSARVPYSCK